MATASTAAVIPVNAVNVNFIFANYEKKVVLATTLSSSGADLKAQLLENWPEGVPVCEDRSRIRMVCMGNGFLQDEKPLGPKFPIFPHPTPINVSIRPVQVPFKSTSAFLTSLAAVPNTSNAPRVTRINNNNNNNNNRYNGNHQNRAANTSTNSGPTSGINSGIGSGSQRTCPRPGMNRGGNGSNSTTVGSGGGCCVIN